jgi:predicted anti-sigma-YlaC factor YlaD
MTGEHDRLIDALLGPDGPEVSCETCFDELDVYVDATLAGRHADLAVPGMRAHLRGCPACREDFDALLDLAGS